MSRKKNRKMKSGHTQWEQSVATLGRSTRPSEGQLWQTFRNAMAMSALGQKRTYAPQQAMSALPPIATAKADMPQ